MMYDELGEKGFDVFHAWSATGGTSYKGERDCRNKWRHSASKTDIHIATLFHYANEYDATWRDGIDKDSEPEAEPEPDVKAEPEPDAKASPLGLIHTSAEFIDGFVPPDYMWDGIMQRRFLYGLTAPTGAGKTSVALALALHAAMGRSLDGRTSIRYECCFSPVRTPTTFACGGSCCATRTTSVPKPWTSVSCLTSYR
jgi:hypothetical protein